jgi:hypothetical protein
MGNPWCLKIKRGPVVVNKAYEKYISVWSHFSCRRAGSTLEKREFSGDTVAEGALFVVERRQSDSQL